MVDLVDVDLSVTDFLAHIRHIFIFCIYLIEQNAMAMLSSGVKVKIRSW